MDQYGGLPRNENISNDSQSTIDDLIPTAANLEQLLRSFSSAGPNEYHPSTSNVHRWITKAKRNQLENEDNISEEGADN